MTVPLKVPRNSCANKPAADNTQSPASTRIFMQLNLCACDSMAGLVRTSSNISERCKQCCGRCAQDGQPCSNMRYANRHEGHSHWNWVRRNRNGGVPFIPGPPGNLRG